MPRSWDNGNQLTMTSCSRSPAATAMSASEFVYRFLNEIVIALDYPSIPMSADTWRRRPRRVGLAREDTRCPATPSERRRRHYLAGRPPYRELFTDHHYSAAEDMQRL